MTLNWPVRCHVYKTQRTQLPLLSHSDPPLPRMKAATGTSQMWAASLANDSCPSSLKRFPEISHTHEVSFCPKLKHVGKYVGEWNMYNCKVDYLFLFTCVGTHATYIQFPRRPERLSDSLELKLQAVVIHLIQVWATELRFSPEEASTLNCWNFFSALNPACF